MFEIMCGFKYFIEFVKDPIYLYNGAVGIPP